MRCPSCDKKLRFVYGYQECERRFDVKNEQLYMRLKRKSVFLGDIEYECPHCGIVLGDDKDIEMIKEKKV